MIHSIINRVLLGIFLLVIVVSCKPNPAQDSIQESIKKEAPAYFKAKFETSKGDFEIESRREWSPAGVNRLYQLIESDFYSDIAIFRVLPDYIAQFGIHNDSLLNNRWYETKVVDEVVLKPNTKGTISFARSGAETRGTILFINLIDNSPKLDTISYLDVTGFPVIAEITSGIDVANSFYNGYGAELDAKQDSIFMLGNEFLKSRYPKLDYIQRAYITETDEADI